MQNELRIEYPDLAIQIVGVNEVGHESANSLMTANRTAPVLQDVDADNNGSSDVWYDQWDVTYRDVKILNTQNELAGTVNLTPPDGYDLSAAVNYDALKQVFVGVAQGRRFWQNPDSPTDVNDDERTTAVDALQCINELALGTVSGSSINLPLPMPGRMPKPYLDVNGDDRITAIDALRVINRLIEQTAAAEGEPMVPDAGFMMAEGEAFREHVSCLAPQSQVRSELTAAPDGDQSLRKVGAASSEPWRLQAANDLTLHPIGSNQPTTSEPADFDGTDFAALSFDAVDRVFGSDEDLL